MNEPARASLVLVIDDEEGIRDMLSFALPARGYRVATAADGREAVAVLEKGGVDLILCDLTIPGTDGPELLADIRRLSPEARLLLATGSVTPPGPAELPALGACACLQKPYEIEDLCGQLGRALREGRRVASRASSVLPSS